jgi:RNA polymerase sigma factor (TIGR02999 family)
MTNEASSLLTALLERARDGDRAARDEVLKALYGSLRELAGKCLRGERRGHTLQATALVHEACLQLLKGQELPGRNRLELLGFMARAMRNVLIDHARARGSLKRGRGRERVDLDADLLVAPGGNERLLDLDDALRRLEKLDPRKCRVVELRYFGGLSVEEIAATLEVSPATVKRDWQVARTWLFRELTAGGGDGDGDGERELPEE